MTAFAGERAVVVGAGVSGLASAEALVAEGASVVVTDRRPPEELAELRIPGAEVVGGAHEPAILREATLVVVSPGVPPDAPILAWARELGLPVWGELELGARLGSAPTVAVTGTNGKTTTTGMIEASLRAGGIDAVACGNVGYPFPRAARERHDALVVEASSFQLAQQESFHPRVSVLLNLAPDHLDWHGSFEAYADAKARVFARQSGDDVHVGNRDDPSAVARSRTAPCAVTWFGLGSPGEEGTGYEGDRLVVAGGGGIEAIAEVHEERPGHRADAAAAASASLAFGVSIEAVAEGLASFRPGRHRGEVVATAGGLRFVDDSKATNVHAALAAIATVTDAVLIAGGRAKGVDLSPLAAGADHLRAVVAIGEAADDVVATFRDRLPVSEAPSIEEAVRAAAALAAPGGTVLLAPACASWDGFRDYAERGDRFAAAARALDGTGVDG